VDVRQALRGRTFDNDEAKERLRFGAVTPDTSHAPSEGAPGSAGTRSHMRWFGVTVASCTRGDVRQSPNGLYVYSDAGRREIPVYGGRGTGMLEMRELYECLVHDTPIVHDGRWGLGTLEVATTILQSARERREVMLTNQGAVD
jgi:phthalate 4,5-cis-dihydrodiol dehydrogenase